jgi:hypothetical protein
MEESTINLAIKLFPLVVGTAVVPSLVILVILLLESNQGLFKAGAFVGGMVIWRLFLVTIFVYYAYLFEILFTLHIPERIHFAILSLLGIILLIVSFNVQRKKDLSSNKFLNVTEIADRINPPLAFILGAVLMATGTKHYIFMLDALHSLEISGVSGSQWTFAIILFILAAELLVLLPILIYLLVPARSEAILGSFKYFLDKYSPTIVVIFCTILGCFFLWRAFSLS